MKTLLLILSFIFLDSNTDNSLSFIDKHWKPKKGNNTNCIITFEQNNIYKCKCWEEEITGTWSIKEREIKIILEHEGEVYVNSIELLYYDKTKLILKSNEEKTEYELQE